MTLGAHSLAVILSAVASGALTYREAATLAQYPTSHGMAFGLWVRRTALRTLGAGLFAVGAIDLACGAVNLVWGDLDRFLQRDPSTLLLVCNPAWATLKVVVGLTVCCCTFEPFVAMLMAAMVAIMATFAWWVTARQMPLAGTSVVKLAGLMARLALPAAVAALALRLRRPAESGMNAGLRRAAWASVLMLLLAAPTADAADGSGMPWVITLNAAVGVATTLIWLAVGRREWGQRYPARLARPWLVLRGLGVSLLEGSRPAWITSVAILCLWQITAMSLGWPLVLRAERRVLDKLTAWPQLLAYTSEPTPAQWRGVVAGLQRTVDDYGTRRWCAHPWCGRYLVIIAWIDATQLGQTANARLALKEAARRWPKTATASPPDWPPEHTIGGLARALEEQWGRTIEPGSGVA